MLIAKFNETLNLQAAERKYLFRRLVIAKIRYGFLSKQTDFLFRIFKIKNVQIRYSMNQWRLVSIPIGEARSEAGSPWSPGSQHSTRLNKF